MSTLLKVPEVAERLRLSERTIRKRIASGELRALRLGSTPHAPLRVDESALDEFMSVFTPTTAGVAGDGTRRSGP